MASFSALYCYLNINITTTTAATTTTSNVTKPVIIIMLSLMMMIILKQNISFHTLKNSRDATPLQVAHKALHCLLSWQSHRLNFKVGTSNAINKHSG